MTSKPYDIVVFGASSFVGSILVRYLAAHLAQHDTGLKWAIAGRNKSKLDALQQQYNLPATVLIADSNDTAALANLCAQTRVVVSTVGPYALYGENLVHACATAGIDYCDLTGEVQWVKAMIDKYEALAKQSGARIVHCCGFDSIPSDMGVWFTQNQYQSQFNSYASSITMRTYAMRGGMSGGTVASMVNIISEAAKSPALRKQLADPYLLSSRQNGCKQDNVVAPRYHAASGKWSTVFIMAGINTRIVHRSNYLLGSLYGNNFKYDEAMLTGKGITGIAMAAGVSFAMAAFVPLVAIRPTRALLQNTILPKPGEGPSEQAQNDGFWKIRFYAEHNGQMLVTQVSGDKDPGYGSTAKMLGQCAIALARNETVNNDGGFYTTGALFAQPLVDRLQQHAGLKFTLVS